jgi:plasmid maintenance system antidote protein VapI
VDTALMLAKVFGNTPDFWLNVQTQKWYLGSIAHA